MSLLDKIYNSDIVTKKEMMLYASNKLSESQKSEIEQKLMNNKFNSDAFDGLSKNKKFLKNNISISNGLNFFYSLIFIVSFISTSFVVVNHKKNIPDSKTTITKKTFTSDNRQNKNNNTVPENIKKDKKQIIVENINKVKKQKRVYEYLPLIKSKTVNKLTQVKVKNNLNSNLIKLRLNFRIKYLQDTKVVDYSIVKRINNLTNNNNDIWNVAPEYANNYEQQTSKKRNKSLEYTYFDFLETGLKYFNNKNYDDAIEVFDIILSQYDNDLNAVFYKGLSYFYKEEYTKAIKNFDIAINADINVFYQEALWYKALCFEKINNNPKTTEILKQIADENGFYVQKAKQKLKTKE